MHPPQTLPLPGTFSRLKHPPRREIWISVDRTLQVILSWIRVQACDRYQGSRRGKNDRTIVALTPQGAPLSTKEAVNHMR